MKTDVIFVVSVVFSTIFITFSTIFVSYLLIQKIDILIENQRKMKQGKN